MKITLLDRSNYFRGLLLLISKDRRVTDAERRLMKRIGKSLGFEREFCENAIDGILKNNYIDETTPKFSSKEITAKFIRDGLVIASCDGEIHSQKAAWLRLTAKKNKLNPRWYFQELEIALERKQHDGRLEVDYFVI